MTDNDVARTTPQPNDETSVPTAVGNEDNQSTRRLEATEADVAAETAVDTSAADQPQTVPVVAGSTDEAADTSPEAEEQPLTLPMLPLRGTVVFPLTVVPLAAAQARSLRLIDEVMSGDRTVALVMQKDAEQEGAGPEDVHEVGTIAMIHQMMRVPDGSVRLAVQGTERMRPESSSRKSRS